MKPSVEKQAHLRPIAFTVMKMSFSYSLISLYVISILMSHLYNERDREMRWLIEKDSGSRNYDFNPDLSFSLFLNLKSFLNECDTD
jgi:hypothetical protein